MREIKFKAWIHGNMIPWAEMGSNEYFKDFFFLKYATLPPRLMATLLQFTGEVDKNGKEIFEGDIVRHFDGPLCLVEFKQGAFGITGKRISQFLCFASNSCEVVGNYYENPELHAELLLGEPESK